MKHESASSVKCFAVSALVFAMAFGFAPGSAHATNGMNLEGYGPVATGMGGASMAYDNGTAAVMNNPATLSLMPEGNRIDAALGYLGPSISLDHMGMHSAESSATAFFMPAVGWAQKSGQLVYGLGVFTQGGMGTEFGKDSFMALGSGDTVRSEVGVGRAIVPFGYEVNKELSIAVSADFVWAGMDVKMPMSGDQFFDMTNPMSQISGAASGTMVDIFGGAFQPNGNCGANPCLDATEFAKSGWARFDFSNDSAFTGEATGSGFAGKLGATYKISPALTVGATYHSKTALGDLETGNAKLSMKVVGLATSNVPTDVIVTGKLKVKDFQWPQTVGLGAAYQATDKLLLVLDYKWINWKDSMKDFTMTFTADDTQSSVMTTNFGLAGKVMDATLYQNWIDQHVFMLGAGYKATDELTVRGGVNVGNKPILNNYLNPLFPAIIRYHVMVGGGYAFSKTSSVDLSVTYAPEVEVTNSQNIKVSHSQTNSQVMYSYRF